MGGARLQLTAALDKKEALLQQLRAMNDEAAAGAQVDPVTKRHSETFQHAYAAVVLQLKQVRLPGTRRPFSWSSPLFRSGRRSAVSGWPGCCAMAAVMCIAARKGDASSGLLTLRPSQDLGIPPGGARAVLGWAVLGWAGLG